MWPSFFFASILIIALLYIPGYFFARVICQSRFSSLLCSPLFSLFCYVLLGMIYDLAGLSVPWYLIPVPTLLIGITVYAAVRRVKQVPSSARCAFPWQSLACYAVIGLVIMTFYYVRCLDGANSFAQIYDNANHLSLIQSFATSGHYSIIKASLYLSGSIEGSAPIDVSGLAFYPAAWHIVSALACNAASVSAAIAENAANYIFAGLVFPSSVCLLFNYLFKRDRRIVLLGSICCLAFEAFPWGMMLFGPLYSNMMAFCVLPLVMYSVGFCFSFEKGKIARGVALVMVGGVVLGASQPNAIFSAIVLMLPYCVRQVYSASNLALKSSQKASICALLFALSIAVLWIALWSSSAFRSVVSYSWPSFASVTQSVVNVIALSLRDSPVQLALGFFVLFGVVSSLYGKQNRWLIWSYVAAAAIYCVAASTDGTLKSLMAGFWYNDSYRLASMLALSAMPLAALGLSATIGIARRVAIALKGSDSSRIRSYSAALIVIPFVLITFAPAHTLAGVGNIETAFSRVEGGLSWLSDPENRAYTLEEAEFARRAEEIVSQDPGVIVNFAYDGSVFSFASEGLDVLYRSFSSFGGDSETSESQLLRTALDRIASDDQVRAATESINAKYVLLLDSCDRGKTIHEDLYSEANYVDWCGVLNIAPSTEGFELELSEGDMKLYRIAV